MFSRVSVTAALLAALTLPLAGNAHAEGYTLKNLAANQQIYAPEILDAHMKNAWGMAIRPKGKGGHFWINNTDDGTVSTYVGDVGGKALYQDGLKFVTISAAPGAKEHAHPTGQVYNPDDHAFMVTQEDITAESRFIFATEEGTVSGWPEIKNADGTFQRSKATKIMVDNGAKGAVYKGLALSEKPDHNRLYAADFGRRQIDVFDEEYKPVKLGKDAFVAPSVPKNYGPFNVQSLNGTLYVAYAETSKKPGEEEKGNGKGYVAAFDYDGKLIREFEGKGKLNAPWGLAIAPANFGSASGRLLVGNFGDGKIIAFDQTSGKQLDALRRPDGEDIAIDGLWGLIFGNGESLGEANHLYFSAGPSDEANGMFGKLIPTP